MVTFVFESFNEEYNMFSPNNWPTDWEIFGSKIPADIKTRLVRSLPYHVSEKITCKLYNELNENEKYFYPIMIEKLDYIKTMDSNNFSFNFIKDEIIQDVYKNRAKIIFLLFWEGFPSIVNTDFISDDFLVLDRWCKEFNFSKDQVYYHSGNLLGSDLCENLNFSPLISNDVIAWNPPLDEDLNFQPNHEKYLFLSYNRIAKLHRTLFVCELIKNNLLSKGLVSYLGNSSNQTDSENKVDYIGRADLLEAARNLDFNRPLILDIDDLENNNPINIGTIDHYKQTFVSVITETLFDNEAIFITEKTWKTISIGHPFFVIGSKHFLKKLKKYGFKTFDNWFDESYDEMDTLNDRIGKIVSELNRLNNLSLYQLIMMRQEMSETLKFNKMLHSEYYRKIFSDDNDFSFLGQINNIKF